MLLVTLQHSQSQVEAKIDENALFKMPQMKLSSLVLAKEYMKRVAKQLQSSEPSQDGDLLIQGVRFAFRVHQV